MNLRRIRGMRLQRARRRNANAGGRILFHEIIAASEQVNGPQYGNFYGG